MKPRDEEYEITEYDLLVAMQRFGGGFASALAVAWMRADQNNAAKLRREFSDLLNSYARFIGAQS